MSSGDPFPSTLAKQKRILEILSTLGTRERQYYQFRDCLHHIPHYVSRLYQRSRSPETTQIRCALKHKCPKCMDISCIESARRPDFRIIRKAAAYLGGGEHGDDCRVWLLSIRSNSFTGKKLRRAFSKVTERHRPLMSGPWAGEVAFCQVVDSIDCCHFAAISSNSHKGSTTFVFNVLVFASPESDLDEKGLEAKFPGMQVERFHGKLGTAWQTYLRRWATTQLTDASPESIVEWMDSGARMFQPIGELCGIRTRERVEYVAKLHQQSGPSARIGFFHRLEQTEDVIARIDNNLPANVSHLLDGELPDSERRRIMSMLKPQVRTVLSPPMTDFENPRPMTEQELRTRLEELREMQAHILRVLEDRDKDATSTRVPPKPDKVM